jgi:mannose-6-phosphate isomerase-like protein (cupin superfamily)
MKGFKGNIEQLTLENDNFRKVIYTAQHVQLVLMSLEVGEDIGSETHLDNDQFFRFESGEGKCIIDNTEYHVAEGDAIVVPAGAEHNVVNTGTTAFKMYTIYGPPNHQEGTIRKTKMDAARKDEAFDGKTTE